MPDRIPKLSHHKASGNAVVRLGGRDVYVGLWGMSQAKAEYDRVVAEWLAGGRRLDAAGVNDRTVAELIAAFWDHAQIYYLDPDGAPTNELRNFRDALRPLRRLYGHTSAAKFGPLALKAVRQAMVADGLCRTSINRRINRLKHLFKWGVENELIPATVYHGLQAVAGLKAGRSEARESVPVRPVPDPFIHAVLGYVSPQIGAMARLQRITGMRPGEVIAMRGVDLDTAGTLWVYRPTRHKTGYLGHERLIFLGPKAQAIIKPFLKPDLAANLFSPADAEAERRVQRFAARRTPLSSVPAQIRKLLADYTSRKIALKAQIRLDTAENDTDLPNAGFNGRRFSKATRVFLTGHIRQGERNDRLFSAAREMRDYGVPQELATNQLAPAARSSGLDDPEISRTIDSAYSRATSFAAH